MHCLEECLVERKSVERIFGRDLPRKEEASSLAPESTIELLRRKAALDKIRHSQ